MSASDAEQADYRPVLDPDAAGRVEVGIDVIEIGRVRLALARHGTRFVRRILGERERERFTGRPQELAARFAAKEATMKALGTGTHGIRWHDVEVAANARGKPIIILHDTAQTRAGQLGLTHFSLSLTHSRNDAIAIVVASRTREPER